MRNILNILIMLAIIALTCFSCTPSKAIRANISASDEKVVEYKGKQYLIKEGAVIKPKGEKVTLKPTRNKKKANVTIINH